MRSSFASFILLALVVGQAHAGKLAGVVVGVADGDTITVFDASRRSHKIRLAGIDAPERTQPYGRVAKERMADLVFRKQVEVETRKNDRYGRTIGVVWTVGECPGRQCQSRQGAGLELIADGLAWHYKAFAMEQPKDERQRYAQHEEAAKRQHVGLWSDTVSLPPWEWRAMRKANSRSKR